MSQSDWEYEGEFATIITPEAMQLSAHGFRVTRTRENGIVYFSVLTTGICVSTRTLAGEISEDEAFRNCVEVFQRQQTRHFGWEPIRFPDPHYQAQYAYASGYWD